jgi:ABC-2 type transport system permease protein
MIFDRSLWQLVKCRWREFCREPSALYWVIFMPIFWMVVLGQAFQGDRREIHAIGVEPVALGTAQNDLLESLKADDGLKIQIGTQSDLQSALIRGDIVLYMRWSVDGIQYFFDPQNPNSVRAHAVLDDLIQRKSGRIDVIPTARESLTVRGSKYVEFLIPGLLALSIMSTSLFGVSMTIVSNRKENLLKLFMVTPMSPSSYLLSHIIGRFFSLAVEFSAVMLAAWLFFGFQVNGSFSIYVLVATLGCLAFTAIAMACAARIKSIPMISGLTNLLMIVMVMFSGVFFSKSNYPDWLQPMINALPLTSLVDGLRRVALEGANLSGVQQQCGWLIAYTILGFGLTRLRFRWY